VFKNLSAEAGVLVFRARVSKRWLLVRNLVVSLGFLALYDNLTVSVITVEPNLEPFISRLVSCVQVLDAC
jgi:hypothetical protein